MRTVIFAIAALACAVPATAQQQHQHESQSHQQHAGGGSLPEGWQARLDRAGGSMENVRFMSMGDDYHVMLGPAAIFYNPANTAQGQYRAHASFTQMKAPQHPEAYGLIAGGRKLEGADQDYLYFLVRGDGKFLVKHRAGTDTHTLFDWTEHAAINKADASGKATNALAIQAEADGVRFLVNGTEVAMLQRAAHLNTDGIVGLRINHNLDLHVSDFGIEPMTGANAAAGSR